MGHNTQTQGGEQDHVTCSARIWKLLNPKLLLALFLTCSATYLMIPTITHRYNRWMFGPVLCTTPNPRLSRLVNNTATKSIPGFSPSVVTMVVIEADRVDMFYNFYESGQRVGVWNIVPVTLTRGLDLKLYDKPLTSYYEPDSDVIHAAKDYYKGHRKSEVRYAVALKILKLGHSVLLCDLDTVFVDNPFQSFNCTICDFEVQQEDAFEEGVSSLHPGIILLRPTIFTIDFLEEFVKVLHTFPKTDPMRLFNQMVHKIKFITYRRLPFSEFPTGFAHAHYYHIRQRLPLVVRDNVVRLSLCGFQCGDIKMFHCGSWHSNYAQKKYRLQELALWVYDKNGYYNNVSRKYITYEHPIAELTNTSMFYMDVAFEIAKRLGRTLILPAFNCPVSRRKICTLSEWMDIEELKKRHPDFREHSFLANPKVPAQVKTSQSDPIFIRSSLMERFMTIYPFPEKGTVYIPLKYPAGPTFAELRQWMKPYLHMSVIHLHSVYFNISAG